MQKPKGMSRKDARNLKAIVREFLNPSVIVEFGEKSASGFLCQNHDEGFNARFVEVSLSDIPGRYEVRQDSWGKDCDGRHSTNDNYIVGETSHRRRYYMGRNWATNRPTGKFGVKSRFQVCGKGSHSQRDYTAEAAGY